MVLNTISKAAFLFLLLFHGSVYCMQGNPSSSDDDEGTVMEPEKKDEIKYSINSVAKDVFEKQLQIANQSGIKDDIKSFNLYGLISSINDEGKCRIENAENKFFMTEILKKLFLIQVGCKKIIRVIIFSENNALPIVYK